MAIRSTRSSINFWMRIALTQRNRRTPHADIVTTRVRGMLRASVRQHRSVFGRSDRSSLPASKFTRPGRRKAQNYAIERQHALAATTGRVASLAVPCHG
jgi:hypothetical protein